MATKTTVRCDLDQAGGTIRSVGQDFFTVLDGTSNRLAVLNDQVDTHAAGTHVGATMTITGTFFTINGLLACQNGDAATCGHTAGGTAFLTLTE